MGPGEDALEYPGQLPDGQATSPVAPPTSKNTPNALHVASFEHFMIHGEVLFSCMYRRLAPHTSYSELGLKLRKFFPKYA